MRFICDTIDQDANRVRIKNICRIRADILEHRLDTSFHRDCTKPGRFPGWKASFWLQSLFGTILPEFRSFPAAVGHARLRWPGVAIHLSWMMSSLNSFPRSEVAWMAVQTLSKSAQPSQPHTQVNPMARWVIVVTGWWMGKLASTRMIPPELGILPLSSLLTRFSLSPLAPEMNTSIFSNPWRRPWNRQ